MPETIESILLLHVTGEDRPGITASLTGILGSQNIEMLDVNQTVIHKTLLLGMLVRIPADVESTAVLKDLLFAAHHANLRLRITPVEDDQYDAWVQRQGKPRFILTLLARRLAAEHLAAVSSVIAGQELNIDDSRRYETDMSPNIDEPVQLADYDPRWPSWYEADAAEIRRALGPRLLGVQHFGSTSVPGMVAKPIIDVLVAPRDWPFRNEDRLSLEGLGYEHLGEAGVPGRQYLRRRSQHDTNLAVVKFEGPVWRDALLLRDFLRRHPVAASVYARKKQEAWAGGGRRLLAYSAEKAAEVASLLQAAKEWQAGLPGD